MRDRPQNGIGDSFRCATRGLKLALRQRNLRIHLSAAALVVGAAVWLHLSPWQWGLLVVAIAMVVGAEIINTALEHVVDLASPGYAELARTAKDVAAGAVLLTALAALILGNVIFGDLLAAPLADAVAFVGQMPLGLVIGVFVGSLLLAGGWWFGLDSCQRWHLWLLAPCTALCSWCLVRWPSLPALTGALLLHFVVWMAARIENTLHYTVLVLTWSLLLIWVF